MNQARKMQNIIKLYEVRCPSCDSILGILTFKLTDPPIKLYCQKCPLGLKSVKIRPLNTVQKIITKRVRMKFGKKRRGRFPEETDMRFGEKYVKTGKIQTIERVYDRTNDNYRKTIINSDGEVVMNSQEKLSSHRNIKKRHVIAKQAI